MGMANDVGTALDAFSGAVSTQTGNDPAVATNAWGQPVTTANAITQGLLGTAYDVGTAPVTTQAGAAANAQVPGSATSATTSTPSGGGGGIFGALTHFVGRAAQDVGGALDKAGETVGLGHVTHDIGHTLTNLAQWDRDAYTAGISRPVSTVLNEATNVAANGVSSLFNGNQWAKSWNESEYISPGQAMVQVGRWAPWVIPGAPAAQHFLGRESAAAAAAQAADPNYIQQEYLGNSFASRALSGGNDALLGWFTDPLAVAGKAFTVIREGSMATEGIKTTEDVTKNLAKPSVSGMLAKTGKIDARTARQMPWIAKSANPDLLAGIFNKTVDANVRELAYRSAISNGMDAEAADQLSELALQNDKAWGAASDQAAATKEAIANANQPFNTDVQLAQATADYLADPKPELYDAMQNAKAGVSTRRAANTVPAGSGMQDYFQTLNAALDDAEKKINMLGNQGRVLADIKNLNGMVHWQPGRLDVPLAQMRAAFQSADKFGDSSAITGRLPLSDTLPGRWVYQTLYKGLYNTPLKVLRAFGDQWPDGWVDLTNVKAGDQLRGYLSRARGMDPEHANQLMNNYYAAGSNLSAKLAATQAIEHDGLKSVLTHAGFDDDEAEAIINDGTGRRMSLTNNVKQRIQNSTSRTYSGAVDPETGESVDMVGAHYLDEDGVPHHSPIMASMLAQGTPMLPLDHVYREGRNVVGAFKTIRKAESSAQSAVVSSSELFNNMWKNSVLLRLGFTPRVMTDMGLRSLATLGGARMMGVTKEAAKTALHNAGATGLDYTNRMLKGRLFDPDTIDNVADKAAALTNVRDATRADYLHAALQKAVDDQATRGYLDAKGVYHKGLDSLIGTPTDEMVAAKLDRYKNAQRNLDDARKYATAYQKTRFGNGNFKYKGVSMTDIFGAENPEWRMDQVSSSRMIGRMFQRNADMSDGLSGTGNWATIRATSQNELEAASHMPAWAHHINNQIMKDDLGSKVVRNNWNEDDVQRWFRTTEGKAYLKKLPPDRQADPELAAHAVVQDVHYSVPPVVRDKLIQTGRSQLSPKELNTLVPDAADRPDVPGQLLSLQNTHTQGVLNMMQHWQHTMHKWLGSMPLDTFVYHPTAAALYRGHLSEAIDKYVSFNGLEDAKTLDFNDGLRQDLEKQAFGAAKSDLWNIMYDLSVKSTAAHQLRFIFPFFNAQQEIIKHWFNIAMDHPAIIQRANQIWNAPDKAGLVYDSQTGNLATSQTPVEDRVVRFQIPHFLSNIPGLGVLDDMGQMQINKQSINPILQGKSWYVPGAGPIAQVAVQAVARVNPGVLNNKYLNAVMPYGPGDNLASAILPAWAERLNEGMNVSNGTYASAFARIYQAETIRYNEGLRSTAPTMGEIQSRTRQMLILQAISSATLPFSASFNAGTQRSAQKQTPRANMVPGTSAAPDLSHTPIQALVDQYKKMEQANPSTAMNDFYQKYGQALFTITMATTKTNADVPATAQGLADLDNPDMRAILAQDPSIAYAVVGPTAAQGSFSDSAYQAELNTPIGGGNTTNFRSYQDPVQMISANNTDLGWQEYDQFMSLINAKMAERGVTSLNQTGASDLKTLKAQFIYNMSTPGTNDYNPDWYNAYSGSGVDWNQRIQSLTALVSDPNITNNPGRTDLQYMGTYLEGRQELNALLAARPNSEGLPSSISDKSNADLAADWDNFVSGLVMKNTGFALDYQHLLAGDPLSAGLKSNATFQQSLSGIVGQ